MKNLIPLTLMHMDATSICSSSFKHSVMFLEQKGDEMYKNEVQSLMFRVVS